jgi:hypothetical protein
VIDPDFLRGLRVAELIAVAAHHGVKIGVDLAGKDAPQAVMIASLRMPREGRDAFERIMFERQGEITAHFMQMLREHAH